jgi:oligopeptide transport system permease protein
MMDTKKEENMSREDLITDQKIAAESDSHDFMEAEVGQGSSLTKDAWNRLKKNKMAMFGLVIFIVYAIIALAAPILPIYSYKEQFHDHVHLPPAITSGFKKAGALWLEKTVDYYALLMKKEKRTEYTDEEKAKIAEIEYKIKNDSIVENGKVINPQDRIYWLGTDYLGRDMLSRIIYGGQISILVGLIGTLTSVLLGIVIGAISGYLGGKVDYVIMRVVDVLYGLPYMMIVIIFLAIFTRTNVLLNLFLALSLISWLTVARVVRGQIISLKNAEFVEAAKSMGASTARIIFKHLIPNTAGVIIVFSTLRIPTFIMQEAFLSFLGLGISAPYASWGALIADAVEGMAAYPWRLIYPALAMTLFLFSMNFLGDGLRDAFDPHSKNKL